MQITKTKIINEKLIISYNYLENDYLKKNHLVFFLIVSKYKILPNGFDKIWNFILKILTRSVIFGTSFKLNDFLKYTVYSDFSELKRSKLFKDFFEGFWTNFIYKITRIDIFALFVMNFDNYKLKIKNVFLKCQQIEVHDQIIEIQKSFQINILEESIKEKKLEKNICFPKQLLDMLCQFDHMIMIMNFKSPEMS
ncbi:hypothetical protein BpHYR1_024920 [Brachionus plicatilis]|uniref:Uncharacterized protein n=1 Tax=Brachionus plicatilis TaxID=10195 RepID=A0A3M7RZM9_BRAPC|nr:hypothetical protein BpHYR1_024920 [Brachionus plicatilis]